jgi:peptidoglycan/LPS O-acetylase OafA/YrhL
MASGRIKSEQIEALRGFCALMVVVHHLIIFSDKILPGFEFRKRIVPYTPSGHLMVLVFFLISGYVIGLNYEIKSFRQVGDYLKKRWVRLYPIYVLAILIPFFFLGENSTSVLGNLFFLQNLFSGPIEHNLPLWSLNHEVVYYLLIIPIAFFSIRISWVFIVISLLLSFSVFVRPAPAIVESYLVGSMFWLTGYFIASMRRKLAGENSTSEAPASLLISTFFLLLACDFLNAFGSVLSKISFLHQPSLRSLDNIVNANDMSAYLFAAYALVACSGIRNRLLLILQIFVFASCWIHLAVVLINGSFFQVSFFYLPAVFLVIASLLLFTPMMKSRMVNSFLWVASVSYGLYVIHMPLFFIVSSFVSNMGIQPNVASYFLVSLTYVLVTLSFAYLLEIKFQMWVKKKLLKTS